MNTSDRYWKIWRIDPAQKKLGYKRINVEMAQEFVNSQFADIENTAIQSSLFSIFKGDFPNIDLFHRAKAGLCLRCYISEAILLECKKIDYLYSGEKRFNYWDLLPFVLNDDGKNLIILDKDGKTQLNVDKNNQLKQSTFDCFALKILQTYNADLQSGMSLDNWAHLQTRQNHEIKKFLSEFGLKHLTDWAILNRVGAEQLERLSLEERYIVEAYHAVYRRDRQLSRNPVCRKCPDPTSAQLEEMLVYLRSRQVSINTTLLLFEALKRIAFLFRRYDIWTYRENLYVYDVQSETSIPRSDLYTDDFNEINIEEQELLQFLREHLDSALAKAIKQQCETNIQRLQKSRNYAPYAQKYIWGLQLYYHDAMTLKQITPILKMTSWNQARRILNPGEVLSGVRAKTTELMLEAILKLAAQKSLTNIPPSEKYFANLIKQVELYIDKEIFQEASEEMRTGTNRKMNSVYAQAICAYIQEVT